MFEDNLKERYGLAIDRIAEIKENSEIEDAGLAAYFTYTAEFLYLWRRHRQDFIVFVYRTARVYRVCSRTA